MEKEKKFVSRKRWGFWRSYSFVLTLAFVCSFSVFGSSALKYTIEGGIIYREQLGRWVAVDFGASKPGQYTDADFKRVWASFAQETGIASASAGGGMSLDEFTGYFGPWTTNSLGQLFKDYFYYRPAFDQYLDADGEIKTLVSTSGMPDEFYLPSLVSLGLRGLRSVMLDNASANHLDLTSGFAANHKDLDALLSKLTAVNTNVISFKNTNHTDLTSGFSVNHQDLTTLNKSLVGSGSASAVFWDSTTKEESPRSYTDVLSAITSLGSSMQNDLAKLRYVLASDKDIEIAEKQEPVKDAVSDSFTGEGPAAVKPDDVGNMAGISGGLQDSLNTGANAGDVLGFLNGSDGWGFWSQEVANGLHNVPASAAEDEVSIYYGDIDSFEDLSFEDFAGVDFIHFYDPSALDNYLSRGDVS